MKVYLASDHAGFALKGVLAPFIRTLGHEVVDLGPAVRNEDDDYPQMITPCAHAVVEAQQAHAVVEAQQAAQSPTASDDDTVTASVVFGVVIGGSGQGEAMAANRVAGVRAAVFYGPHAARGPIEIEGTTATAGDDYDIVRLSRTHNDANVLSLGARFVSDDEACEAVRIFLSTAFSGNPRHARRIKELA